MPLSRPIQQLTNGFLGLLGLKTNGVLPDVLLDQVRPTIDMGEWYKFGPALTKRAGETSLVDVAGIIVPTTGGERITVPDGKVWWVHELTAVFQPGALATEVFCDNFSAVVLVDPTTAILPSIIVGEPANAPMAFVTNNQFTGGMDIYCPSLRNVLVPSGAQFACSGIFSVRTAGLESIWDVSITVRYTEFQAG